MRRVIAAELLISIAAACHGAQRTEDPIAFSYPAFLTATVSVDDQTWVLFGPNTPDERPSTICKLVSHDLTCAKVPASARGARLVDPGAGVGPLIALAIDDARTLYVEPFTWRTFRLLDGVSFKQRAIVLRDGTMWVDLGDNLLVVPKSRQPRLWFANSVSSLFVSPTGVLWREYRGPEPAKQKAVVLTAAIDGDHLGVARERADVGVGWVGWDACHAGTTIGLIDHDRKQLVRFDLETNAVHRIDVGDRMFVHCGPGVVAATASRWARQATDWYDPVVSWCDRETCRSQLVRLPIPYYSGTFTLIDGHVFAVATTLDDTLVTWKVGETLRFIELSRKHEYGFERAISLPDGGALALSIYGPLFVFDRDGSIRPIKLTWSGSPFVPCWDLKC